jgi:hypothetical protein
VEGIFYAKLLANNVAQSNEIDARTSDAIAIALRFSCPIYTYDSILSTYGIVLDEEPNRIEGLEEDEEDKDAGNELARVATDDLNALLDAALEEEDYEKASRIRDELNNRNNL